MTINDVLAALGVVLNGIPQALLAATYGFASIPTAFGFIVGAVACLLYGSAIPISFQAETIALAGMLGKDIRERLSIILFSGITMVILGLTGILSTIVNFAGSTIINAMMAGVGIMLTRISLAGLKESKVVTASSIVSAFITYFFFGQNLVYTIVVCVIFSSLVANIFKINFGGGPVEAIISATAAAPNPLNSGVLMMVIMAVILFFGLLPKISKYIPGHSVHGFLFILGAIVTVPTNASLAFSGGTPQDYVVAATAMTVTAANDPFIGLLVALVVKYIFIFIG